MRKRIEKGIRGNVGGLPRGTPEAQDGRKQYKKIQIESRCRAMEVPRTFDFRSKDPRQDTRSEVRNQRILEYRRGMDNASQGRHRLCNARDDRSCCLFAPNIGDQDMDLRPFPQAFERQLGRGVRLPAPGQHQMTGTGGDQRLGRQYPETTQAADDPIARVIA